MKYKINNYLYLIIIIIISIYLGITIHNTESFTPGLRRIYRPYLRHSRIFYENITNNYQNDINRLFKQFGLY
jgi:hypothetical protein